ncbi:hypothetical protein CR513_37593, partial [Mucuna pruriens]
MNAMTNYKLQDVQESCGSPSPLLFATKPLILSTSAPLKFHLVLQEEIRIPQPRSPMIETLPQQYLSEPNQRTIPQSTWVGAKAKEHPGMSSRIIFIHNPSHIPCVMARNSASALDRTTTFCFLLLQVTRYTYGLVSQFSCFSEEIEYILPLGDKDTFNSQIPCVIAQNSASTLGRDTTFCFLLLHVTKFPPRKIDQPNTDTSPYPPLHYYLQSYLLEQISDIFLLRYENAFLGIGHFNSQKIFQPPKSRGRFPSSLSMRKRCFPDLPATKCAVSDALLSRKGRPQRNGSYKNQKIRAAQNPIIHNSMSREKWNSAG